MDGKSPVITGKNVSSVTASLSPLVSGAGTPAWWNPLHQASCNGSVFLSDAWMQSWLEVYGGDFEGVWIRWEHDGTTVAGCLLLSRVVWKSCVPLRSLYLNATGEAAQRTPLAEFNDILHLAGYAEAVAVDFSRQVGAMSWDRLLLSGHESGGLVDRAIPLIPSALVEHDPRPAPYVHIAALPPKSFEATLTGKVGSHIRRNTRLFEKQHGPPVVVAATSLGQAMRYFRDLSVLHSARWQSRGDGGSFSSPSVVTFHQRLIRRLWSTQAVDLVCVSSGQLAIGYLYNFTSENKVYVFQTGFLYGDDTRLSPGLLTHSMSIEHYRKRGFREYDLLAGGSSYKRALAKHSRTLNWSVIYRKQKWISLLLWIRAMKARFARRNPTTAAPDPGH